MFQFIIQLSLYIISFCYIQQWKHSVLTLRDVDISDTGKLTLMKNMQYKDNMYAETEDFLVHQLL